MFDLAPLAAGFSLTVVGAIGAVLALRGRDRASHTGRDVRQFLGEGAFVLIAAGVFLIVRWLGIL